METFNRQRHDENSVEKAAEMSSTTLAKLGKNETVSMDVMLRICKMLDCGFEDIIDVTKEN